MVIRPFLLLVVVAITACAPGGPPVDAAPAPETQFRHVSGFLKPGYRLQHAWATRSRAHQSAYLFAAQIVGQPASGVGVWLIAGTPDSPGLTLSVDVDAKEFSEAPDGSTSKAQATMADPGAAELQRWVESQVQP